MCTQVKRNNLVTFHVDSTYGSEVYGLHKCWTRRSTTTASIIRICAGDEEGYSDALLSIGDAIAPSTSAALESMARQDMATYHPILAPIVLVSRHMFKAPTGFYKTSMVFMTDLNGHQDHFTMIGGEQNTCSTVHLAALFSTHRQSRLPAGPGSGERARRDGDSGIWYSLTSFHDRRAST
jgi:hypothetical protein